MIVVQVHSTERWPASRGGRSEIEAGAGRRAAEHVGQRRADRQTGLTHYTVLYTQTHVSPAHARSRFTCVRLHPFASECGTCTVRIRCPHARTDAFRVPPLCRARSTHPRPPHSESLTACSRPVGDCHLHLYIYSRCMFSSRWLEEAEDHATHADRCSCRAGVRHPTPLTTAQCTVRVTYILTTGVAS